MLRGGHLGVCLDELAHELGELAVEVRVEHLLRVLLTHPVRLHQLVHLAHLRCDEPLQAVVVTHVKDLRASLLPLLLGRGSLHYILFIIIIS